MKNFRRICIIVILLIIYIYVVAIENIPNSIVLFEGESLDIPTIVGINIENKGE